MSADVDAPISGWLDDLRRGVGVDDATRGLWTRYFRDLVRLAEARLRGAPRGAFDGEDIAQRALDTFRRGVADGQFDGVTGPAEAWRLLVCLTAREASEHLQRERRLRRGGGRVVHASALEHDDGGGPGLAGLAVGGACPAHAAGAMDECRRLFGLLGDETLAVVALLRMEGFTNPQIAASLDCSLRNVEAKLQAIRRAWSSAAGGSAAD